MFCADTLSVGLLAYRVALRDVKDVDAFVCWALGTLHLDLSASERDELEAEGLTILYELERDYDPAIGTFAGHAGKLLPARLLSAWHVLHRGEHMRPHRGPWRYGPAIKSLTVAIDASWDGAPVFTQLGARTFGEMVRAPV